MNKLRLQPEEQKIAMKLRIGLLLADTPDSHIVDEFGDYNSLICKILEKANRHIGATLETIPYYVHRARDFYSFPDIDPTKFDAFIVSGSSMLR